MKKKLIAASIVVLCLPSLVHAQAYKCRKPDGSLSFQDQPCQNGATGAGDNLAPAQGYSAAPSSGQASRRASAPQRMTGTAGDLRAADQVRLNAENPK